MASWITDEKGKWHPAKEKVALTNLSGKVLTFKKKDKDGKEFVESVNPGEPYIYEGPCREALFQLWEIDKTGGTTTIGEDFRTNTEFLESYAKARNAFGFKDVNEYLGYLGFDEKKVKEDFEAKASKVSKHELPNRIAEIKRIGGGDNRANPGKDIRYGGFGEPAELTGSR